MTIVRTLVRWAAPFLILGVGIGIFLALGKQSPPPRAPVTTVEAVPVETAAVLPEEKGIDISTDGVVVPIREVTLAAEVGGRIIMKSPACESGEYVKEGTLLLQIDPRDYELDVERLQREVKQASLAIEEVDEEVKQNASSLDLAKKQVELAHREVMRLDGLTAEGIVTKSTYDLAVRDELTASNTLNGLQGKQRVLAKRRNRFVEGRSLAGTNLKRAELDLARTKVSTPLTGVVGDELAEEDS
ncbi:MAG: hemolysin D, partial [Pirellulales bacterium]